MGANRVINDDQEDDDNDEPLIGQDYLALNQQESNVSSPNCPEQVDPNIHLMIESLLQKFDQIENNQKKLFDATMERLDEVEKRIEARTVLRMMYAEKKEE